MAKISLDKCHGEVDWSTWCEQFKASLALNEGGRHLAILQHVEGKVAAGASAVEEIQQAWESEEEETKATGRELYSLLIVNCAGEALELVTRGGDG